MAKEIELTQDGYDALVKELEYLKTEKRREIAEKIKVARGYGDLSENAEYDAAKDEQGHVEQRIMELERTVKNAKIMNKGSVTKGTVSVGTKVTVVDERNELAGKVGKAFTLDVGVNTDVITGFEKAMAIETAIRTLSPDVIVCDEVSTLKEAQSIKFGFSCGVHFLLSVHIGSFDDLYRRTVLRELLESGFFKKVILLDDNYTAKIIDCEDIYDEADREHIDNFFLADSRNYHGE